MGDVDDDGLRNRLKKLEREAGDLKKLLKSRDNSRQSKRTAGENSGSASTGRERRSKRTR